MYFTRLLSLFFIYKTIWIIYRIVVIVNESTIKVIGIVIIVFYNHSLITVGRWWNIALLYVSLSWYKNPRLYRTVQKAGLINCIRRAIMDIRVAVDDLVFNIIKFHSLNNIIMRYNLSNVFYQSLWL